VRARGGEAPIKGIIFDFGGVIHSFDFGMFFRNLDRRTDRTLGEMSSLVAGSGLPRRYELGEVSSREFYHGIANLCGLRATEEEFVRAFVAIFAPIEPTIGLIRFLSRSYRLGLLSNTNEWHFEHHIRTVDVFPLFDAVTLSYQVKTMKPAEAIYLDMLEKIGFSPEECIFVDDLEENISGARRLNLHAIHYTGHEHLVSSLAELGVVAGQDLGK
jgi:epoxide hydrolase-like predicted phosphatase